MIDQILERVGVKYEELNAEERVTLHNWLETLSKNELTISHIREHIANMRDAVEQELINEPEFNYIFIFRVLNRKQILLKARLKNYMLLEAFLSSPEKAKQAMEKALANLAPKV